MKVKVKNCTHGDAAKVTNGAGILCDLCVAEIRQQDLKEQNASTNATKQSPQGGKKR